jgi:hypothetical protein
MSRSDLVDAYMSGLQLISIAVVGAGKQCRIVTGELPPGEIIQHQFYLRPSHADLVMSRIGEPSGKAAELAGLIKQTAATLGARCQTLDELRGLAARQVDEIVSRIKASGRALKPWNQRYRQYRLEQVAKGEKAVPYAAFLEEIVIQPTVRSIAAQAG